MTPEEETLHDARNRLHDLDHAVAEARAAVDKAPTDEVAKSKLDMAVSVRDAGHEALQKAEARLAESKPASTIRATGAKA